MASKHERTTTIDGRVYRTTIFPTLAALELQRRLVSLLSEQVFTLFAAGSAEHRREALMSPIARAEIIHSVYTRANAGDMSVLCDLMENTYCDKIQLGDVTREGNVAEHFDEHFRGNFDHMLSVVSWVIEANYAGPTDGSHSKSGSASPTPEPTASS
jgi:hypothetical protein